ncbi:MAG: pantoate--beta-alanine ligase, partial [Chloroflexota bacterium]|nr:pantoate--beta-alanine ligase [Chloroflexota bacterium]
MTRVLHTRAELRATMVDAARPVGLVPTMGWLHEGHRALMKRARAENATTVATIFVNPRQFGDASDYTQYPRDTDNDIAICEAEGIDIVWIPEVEEVYPAGFDTTVSVGAVAKPLEGAARPGHFDGVATVVATLFALVGAEHAYFGQKDAQQVMVITRMAADLALPTQVIPCPTVREA